MWHFHCPQHVHYAAYFWAPVRCLLAPWSLVFHAYSGKTCQKWWHPSWSCCGYGLGSPCQERTHIWCSDTPWTGVFSSCFHHWGLHHEPCPTFGDVFLWTLLDRGLVQWNSCQQNKHSVFNSSQQNKHIMFNSSQEIKHIVLNSCQQNNHFFQLSSCAVYVTFFTYKAWFLLSGYMNSQNVILPIQCTLCLSMIRK